MREIEKRRGLSAQESDELKARINQAYRQKRVVSRTILIKVEGDDFTADPNELVDIKVKLIDDEALLVAKYGSWHNDSARQEYEIHFDRADLANMISFLDLQSHGKFVLLSTRRTIWQPEGLTITLDEFAGIGKSLLEIEADGHDDKTQIDSAFASLGITPMASEETVNFINSINHAVGVQVDLAQTTAIDLAKRILKLHAR